MRKGRSQRKLRGSLPPLSMRPSAPTVAADASGPRSGPQVVIGLTGPREGMGEVVETLAPESSSAPAARAVLATTRLEMLAEPSLELVRDADSSRRLLEETREESAESEAREESVASAARLVAFEADPPSDPFARALTEETPVPHTSTLLTPDEISIPPMGDLTVEPIAERFFSEGELAAAGDEDDEAWNPSQDKVQRKSLPHVIERRQRFSRYVRWAVGGAAIVCLAALGRTMLPHPAPAAAGVQAIVAAEPVRAPEPVAVVAPRVEVPSTEAVAPKAEEPKAEEPKAAEPKAAEAKLVDAPAAEAKPAAVAPAGDKTALQEKNDARRQLERGKLTEAIEAGERAVALDPTDGEAWLLLGASYQEKGKTAEARRCYTSCLKEGKRGPLGECRAMMR